MRLTEGSAGQDRRHIHTQKRCGWPGRHGGPTVQAATDQAVTAAGMGTPDQHSMSIAASAMPPAHAGARPQHTRQQPLAPLPPTCMSARSRRRPSSSCLRCCRSCCRSGSCRGAASLLPLPLRLPPRLLLPAPGSAPEPSAARSMELSRGTCSGREQEDNYSPFRAPTSKAWAG